MDQFDDDFASHWDEFVGWDKRGEADSEFLLGLIEKYDSSKILDVAMGTGFHTISLLKSGKSVKSCDVSKSMIDVAHKNAKKHSLSIDAVCCDWISLSDAIKDKFDCIICLGNSLACENDYEKRKISVRNWSMLLEDSGVIIVDRRNYEALLSGEYNLEANKGLYFGDTVEVNPTLMTDKATKFSYTFSTGKTFDLKMYPILDNEIIELFDLAGMELAELYGDRQLTFSPGEPNSYCYVFRKKSE